MVSFPIKKLTLTLSKKFFQKTPLCTHGHISTVKGGEIAIYIHNFTIGKLIVAANSP